MSQVEVLYANGDRITCRGNAGESVLDVIRAAKAEFVFDCMEGECKTCTAQLVEGSVRQLRSEAVESRQGAAILCCQCKTESESIRIQVGYSRSDVLPARERRLTLISATPLGSQCIAIVLESQAAMRFIPGQYLRLTVPQASLTRAYSMANSPSGKRLHLLIKRIAGGAMTKYLEQVAKIGDVLTGHGPHGSFILQARPQPRLFIAGGTGLAPVHAMLQQLAAQRDSNPIRLAFGVNSPEEFFYLEELSRLRDDLIDFDFVVAVRSSELTGSYKQGTVIDNVPDAWSDAIASNGAAYVCGPPVMIGAALEMLARRGVPPDRIHTEQFLAAAG